MEIISMDLRVFDDLTRRVKTIEERAEVMHRNQADLKLKRWLDNDEVCRTLCISKRTLQAYRENGLIPFSCIRHKIFYKPEDVEKLLESSHHSNSSRYE
jgi:predicted site-specific integrase-resolvase